MFPFPKGIALDLPSLYSRQLSAEEIASGEHRLAVGGLWDELGKLQCDFLIGQGLRAEHRLIDVGCGALRGGVHFVRFLEPGHYYGIDGNASFIEAGKRELESAGLADRAANFLVNERFELFRFNAQFDYGIAQSVFTHLVLNHIISCLVQVKRVLAPNGRFYATYFETSVSGDLKKVVHGAGGVQTSYDADPFHYSFEEMSMAAKFANLAVKRIGDWVHPREQKMLCFDHPE
jgi:ubiquinone/menaquinone biosynthesis C-methylase UbiE